MNAEQIINALELCKGKPVEKVLQLIDLMWGEDAVADMAKHFGCPNDKQAVAECLAYDGDKATEVEDLPEDLPETNEGEDTAESTATEKPSEESNEDESADEGEESEGEEEEEKPAGSAEKKEEPKSNLPVGFSFNPLQLAIRPLYEKAKAEDELFAKEVAEKESRKEKPKSLAECAEYIMGEAYEYASKHRTGNFGLAGMPDDEMVGLIKHYYDEDNIEIRKFAGKAKASVATTAKTSATAKKKEEKPKPVKNVKDIRQAIVSATKTEDGKKKGKAKENLNAGFIPMERPETLKDAKKTSRQQAKSVETIDMFADFFANEK